MCSREGLPFRCYTSAEHRAKGTEGIRYLGAYIMQQRPQTPSNAESPRWRQKHPLRTARSSAGRDCPLLQTDTVNSPSMAKALQKKKWSFWHCTWHTHVGMSTPLGGGRDSQSKMCEPGYRVFETPQNSLQSDDCFTSAVLTPEQTSDMHHRHVARCPAPPRPP